jgi:hypothetical protein
MPICGQGEMPHDPSFWGEGTTRDECGPAGATFDMYAARPSMRVTPEMAVGQYLGCSLLAAISKKHWGPLSGQLRRPVGRRLRLDVAQPDVAVHVTSAPSGQTVRPVMAGSENGMLGCPQPLRRGQMIRSWRMASATVCVRLRVPSFVSAFLK